MLLDRDEGVWPKRVWPSPLTLVSCENAFRVCSRRCSCAVRRSRRGGGRTGLHCSRPTATVLQACKGTLFRRREPVHSHHHDVFLDAQRWRSSHHKVASDHRVRTPWLELRPQPARPVPKHSSGHYFSHPVGHGCGIPAERRTRASHGGDYPRHGNLPLGCMRVRITGGALREAHACLRCRAGVCRRPRCPGAVRSAASRNVAAPRVGLALSPILHGASRGRLSQHLPEHHSGRLPMACLDTMADLYEHAECRASERIRL